MAERVRAVGGMDPSPDMLEKARRAGAAGGVGTGWATRGCSPLFGQCCGREGESPW
ncbi:hypothetical protein [Amycolatopsis sulphurea]|nr:hypothetical protein [Amycolatopsis sulphurea]